MAETIKIEKNLILWAIERAGYKLDLFFEQFPLYAKWFYDEKEPTLKQLEKFSHKLHVPFGYLFLDTPPKEEIPIPFYRTLDGNGTTSLNVFDTILILQRRQEWLTDYLINNDFEPLNFVGKFNLQSDVKEIVNDIRNTLNLDINWASKFKTWEEALAFLTIKIEEIGIVMNFNGIVQNNTSRPIKVEECRGFILVDKIAPFMFINNSDAKAAQMFTIIHELAHIWLGVSAGFDNNNMMPANDPIEILCDKVAAEFLVPADFLKQIWSTEQDIKKLARQFKVSPIVIARRILDLKYCTKKQFFDFYNDYMNEFRERKEKMSNGGDFYATTKKRLSVAFAAHVSNAVKANQLLYRDAYKLTGLKGETFNKFLAKSL